MIAVKMTEAIVEVSEHRNADRPDDTTETDIAGEIEGGSENEEGAKKYGRKKGHENTR